MLLELQHRESALGAHTLQIDYFATHGKGLLSKVHNGAGFHLTMVALLGM
jgi:hypothetical protein